MLLQNPVLDAMFWSLATIASYQIGRWLHARLRQWWSTPLLLAPALLIAIALALHEPYVDYIRRTHWLVALLGPATVAFAIPLWEQRGLIRRHWPVLLGGAVIGSCTAMLSVWALADVLGLDRSLLLSLLPRSMSTPFAMTVSGDIGGKPDLTAVFVVFTGILGSALGELVLPLLPLRSRMAAGALLGMGAHGAGVARAHGFGREEGAVAGLLMVLVGILNVLIAPILGHWF